MIRDENLDTVMTEELDYINPPSGSGGKTHYYVHKGVMWGFMVTALISLGLAFVGFFAFYQTQSELNNQHQQVAVLSESLSAVCDSADVASVYRAQCDVVYDYKANSDDYSSNIPKSSSSPNAPSKPVQSITCNDNGTTTITYVDNTSRVTDTECTPATNQSPQTIRTPSPQK